MGSVRDPLLDKREGKGEGESSEKGVDKVINETVEKIEAVLPVGRHALALGFGTNFEKGAALVDKALDGEGIEKSILDGLREGGKEAHFNYFLFIFLEGLWNINLIVLFLINFFEVPLWCKHSFPNPCRDDGRYGLTGIPFLPRKYTLLIEVITLIIVAFQTFGPLCFKKKKDFFSNPFDICRIVLVGLLAVDVFLYSLYVFNFQQGPLHDLSFRGAQYLRILVVIMNASDLRRMLMIFLTAFTNYLDMIVFLSVFLIFSSWLAYILFEDTPQGDIFSNYFTTFYHMHVLLQSQNSPDEWLPAYKNSRLSAVFFVLYLIFGLYFIMNMVLAVIFDSFKDRLREGYKEERTRQILTLNYVFDLLDEEKKGFLDFHQVEELLKELNNYRLVPIVKPDHMDEVFATLDDSHDNKISKKEFTDLCRIVRLRFKDRNESSFLERVAPKFWKSSKFEKVKTFVKSHNFEKVLWGILGLNAITIIIETTLDTSDSKLQSLWVPVEHAIGWLYVFEMLLKISVFGFNTYWRSGQNRFDFFVTVITLVAELLLLLIPGGVPFIDNQEWIRYLLIARLLRLSRLLLAIQRYKVILSSFFRLIPGLTPLISLLFLTLCLFNSLALQLYGGILYSGNPKLEGTDYDDSDYYLTNFNDYVSGLVLLFNVLVTEGNATWMEALQEATGSWTPFAFFTAFYYVCISYVLELVASFVLDAFFMEKETAEEGGGYFTTSEGLEVEEGSSSAYQILDHMFDSKSRVRAL